MGLSDVRQASNCLPLLGRAHVLVHFHASSRRQRPLSSVGIPTDPVATFFFYVLISGRSSTEESTADGTIESWSCVAHLNVVPQEIATGGKLFAVAPVIPATVLGVHSVLGSDIPTILVDCRDDVTRTIATLTKCCTGYVFRSTRRSRNIVFRNRC